ncbi:MAG: agmatinase [Oscillospiraceae bacterium]|nr:agmatinase [Oscillospiraceae bacterium]
MQSESNVFISCTAEYKDAGLVIFGAPFDSTASYRPGARFGCKAMRAESFGIETYSPVQDKDLSDYSIFDAGDLEMSIGSANTALGQIYAASGKILRDGKIPCMLGGEHLVTLGAVRALREKYDDLYILQFDAHADLRDSYLGVKNSHACVMRRCYELVGDGRIFQLGIRSGEREEFKFAKEHTVMSRFNLEGMEEAVSRLAGKNVYFTLDLDVLEPSVFPGTGTPEPGGVSFSDLHSAIMKLQGLNIVGFDITELSPHYDQSGISVMAACKILREILLVVNN